MAIITKSDYKTLKGISATTYDAVLDAMLPMLQGLVEDTIGRAFDTGTYTETWDGLGSPSVFLRNTPITSVTSVTLLSPGSSVVVDSSTYTFNAATGEVSFRPRSWGRVVVDDFGQLAPNPQVPWPQFPEQFQSVRVVYVGGYSIMPPGLKMAMVRFADYYLAEMLNAPDQGNIAGETLGNYTYTRKPPEEERLMIWRFFGPYMRGVP